MIVEQPSHGRDTQRPTHGLHFDERLLGLLPAAVYVCDADGVILYHNQRATDLWGRAPRCGDTDERFCGAFKLYFPDGAFMAHAATPMAETLRNGMSQRNREAVIERPDGARIRVIVNIDPLRNEAGDLVGAVNVFQDITDRKEAEEARGLLAAIVESSDDVIVSKTLDGMITSWNAAAQRLFGYTADEAIGRSITMIIPPERLSEEKEILARLRRGERIEHFETIRVRKDGRKIEVALTVSPVRDATGCIIGASKIARDITERKRAEQALRESERRFRQLADSAPVLIWMSGIDKEGTYFNKPWLDFTGQSLEEQLGNGWLSFVHPDDQAELFEKCLGAFRERKSFTTQFRLRRADGVYRWMFDQGEPRFTPDGGFVGFIGTCVDITERMQLEEKLREADRRKDDFLAMLAHELRNPLAPIRSGLEILAMEENASHREVVSLMQRQLEHLVRLVDDLLDVSRIMRGKVDLRPRQVELKEILAQVVEGVRPVVDAKRQELIVDVPASEVWLSADPVRLVQVFENLVNNASKYSDVGDRIEVTAELGGANGAGQVVVRVRDEGIGIEHDLLPKVFEPFTQSSRSLDRSQGGLGIGLTLVRSLVELHNGRVDVASDGPGRGTTFAVRLPVIRATQNSVAEQRQLPAAQRRRILIVDDNEAAARMLSLLLSARGSHEVEVAHDGEAALEHVTEFRPEVIFLDIGLPGMNGYDVARKIRANSQLDGMMLVALTGYGQERDRQKSKEAGFNEHLVKPPSWEQIQKLLSHPILD